MKSATLSQEFQAAFRSLMDDRSPVVRDSLIRKLEEAGEDAVFFLREIMRGENRMEAILAQGFLESLQHYNPLQEALAFIRSLHYELETGILLLTRPVSKGLNAPEFCFKLNQMSSRVRELFMAPMKTRKKCTILNRVFFHEYGFRTLPDESEDSSLMLPHEVLQSKRGGGMMLGFLYTLLAQRCQLPVEVISVPGCSLLGCYDHEHPFYIDMYAGGSFREGNDILEALEESHLEPDFSHLTPTPVREVLERFCQRTAQAFSFEGQQEAALMFERFGREFQATHRRHANP